MMKQAMALAALATLLLVTTACRQSADEAKAAFCADLAAYGQAVAGLKAIGPTSTVQQAKDALTAVEQAHANLEKSAATLKGAQVDALEQEFKALQQTINDIPNDATLAQAQATVKGATVSALAAYVDATTTTCLYGQPEPLVPPRGRF
jgi:hypothetical protein